MKRLLAVTSITMLLLAIGLWCYFVTFDENSPTLEIVSVNPAVLTTENQTVEIKVKISDDRAFYLRATVIRDDTGVHYPNEAPPTIVETRPGTITLRFKAPFYQHDVSNVFRLRVLATDFTNWFNNSYNAQQKVTVVISGKKTFVSKSVNAENLVATLFISAWNASTGDFEKEYLQVGPLRSGLSLPDLKTVTFDQASGLKITDPTNDRVTQIPQLSSFTNVRPVYFSTDGQSLIAEGRQVSPKGVDYKTLRIALTAPQPHVSILKNISCSKYFPETGPTGRLLCIDLHHWDSAVPPSGPDQTKDTSSLASLRGAKIVDINTAEVLGVTEGYYGFWEQQSPQKTAVSGDQSKAAFIFHYSTTSSPNWVDVWNLEEKKRIKSFLYSPPKDVDYSFVDSLELSWTGKWMLLGDAVIQTISGRTIGHLAEKPVDLDKPFEVVLTHKGQSITTSDAEMWAMILKSTPSLSWEYGRRIAWEKNYNRRTAFSADGKVLVKSLAISGAAKTFSDFYVPPEFRRVEPDIFVIDVYDPLQAKKLCTIRLGTAFGLSLPNFWDVAFSADGKHIYILRQIELEQTR